MATENGESARSKKYREEIDGLISAKTEEVNQLISSKTIEINTILSKAKADIANISKLLGEINSSAVQTKEGEEKIEEFRLKLFEGDDDTNSIQYDIEDSQEEISKVYDKAIEYDKKLFGTREKLGKEITTAQARSLEETEFKEKGGKYYEVEIPFSPGIIHRITEIERKFQESSDEFVENANEQLNTQQARFDQQLTVQNKNFENLKETIEGFLPKALTSGLSAAYREAKKKHQIAERIWGGVFIIAIISMAIVAFYSITTFNLAPEYFFTTFAKTLSLEIPFIWLAWVSGKRVKQEARLYSEYQHKWAVAASFEGLQKQAENLDNTKEDPDTKNQEILLKSLIEAYSENPSKVISTTDADLPFEKTMSNIISKGKVAIKSADS